MNVINKYVCDLCGAMHNTPEQAEACEASHCAPVSILKSEYRNRKPFPAKINVYMSDGSIVRYHIGPVLHGAGEQAADDSSGREETNESN